MDAVVTGVDHENRAGDPRKAVLAGLECGRLTEAKGEIL